MDGWVRVDLHARVGVDLPFGYELTRMGTSWPGYDLTRQWCWGPRCLRLPHWKGQFWEFSGPLKNIGCLCCCVCSKMDHSVLHNGITAQLLQLNAMLPTGWCHISFRSGATIYCLGL